MDAVQDNNIHTVAIVADEVAERDEMTPDGSVILPAYVPNMAETVKASGAHRQGSIP